MSETQNTPLWKQLLGAATGSVVALILYGGFVLVSPNLSVLTAYLSSTFEGKIEHLPTYQRSPKTVREEALARKEAMGDRARAATAKLQGGESYSSSSSVASVVPLEVKKEVQNQPKKKEAVPEEAIKSSSSKKQKEKVHPKRKEEKLPSTGVPLWAIGGVALCLAMSLRYRKELLGVAVEAVRH